MMKYYRQKWNYGRNLNHNFKMILGGKFKAHRFLCPGGF